MAVTAQDLADYCGASPNTDITRSLATAEALVTDVFSAAYRAVPDIILRQVTLEVGQAIFKRSDSPSGASQGVEFGSGQAVIGNKDPLAQVWPIIRRYVLPF